MAELADALDSGSSGLIHMAVEVRFLSSALLENQICLKIFLPEFSQSTMSSSSEADWLE